MQTLRLKKWINNHDAERLAGETLQPSDIDFVVSEDTDAYCDQSGDLLFKFRKSHYEHSLASIAYEALEKSIELNDSRGTASGINKARERKDGKPSNMRVGNKVNSSVVGYMDRSGKQPYCRRTGYLKTHLEMFESAIPFVEAVDKGYQLLAPKQHLAQITKAKGTNRNYIISDTAFTTITVNRDFQTAVHKDAGDFEGGYGNLSVCEISPYAGGYFCLPQWRCGVDVRQGDLLIADVHQWHGNTPIVKTTEAEHGRCSFVMYYRDNMINCLQPSEELKRTKLHKTRFIFSEEFIKSING